MCKYLCMYLLNDILYLLNDIIPLQNTLNEFQSNNYSNVEYKNIICDCLNVCLYIHFLSFVKCLEEILMCKRVKMCKNLMCKR